MPVTRLKSAIAPYVQAANQPNDIVREMLGRIAAGGEAAVRDYAHTLDGTEGEIVVPAAEVAAAARRIAPDLRAAMDYAHRNIRAFAEAQRASILDFQTEVQPGLITGQKLIPVAAAGCYVPGGRYAHIASALMTITTARVAGVGRITAASPPRDGVIPDPILYAMHLAGADLVLKIGGVQAIAAMAAGHFGGTRADVLAGPGNQYVAEAKRQMFGPVGIDMFAGPTDSLVIADASADPELVAWDLVSQAEHGANSPVWLVSLNADLAHAVIAHVPVAISELPEPNRSAAKAAWTALGEVVVCDTADEAAAYADQVAPEHLHVQAADLDWWRGRLRTYGSLFLGADTTVAFGDKASGTNHCLPTSGAARYTGGLSVHKFLKCVTWQQVAPGAQVELALATAVISRAEGMEGHARSADLRLPGAGAQVAQHGM